jgi:hypothetical protein
LGVELFGNTLHSGNRVEHECLAGARKNGTYQFFERMPLRRQGRSVFTFQILIGNRVVGDLPYKSIILFLVIFFVIFDIVAIEAESKRHHKTNSGLPDLIKAKQIFNWSWM